MCHNSHADLSCLGSKNTAKIAASCPVSAPYTTTTPTKMNASETGDKIIPSCGQCQICFRSTERKPQSQSGQKEKSQRASPH